jgi:hypothetical protein
MTGPAPAHMAWVTPRCRISRRTCAYIYSDCILLRAAPAVGARWRVQAGQFLPIALVVLLIPRIYSGRRPYWQALIV